MLRAQRDSLNQAKDGKAEEFKELTETARGLFLDGSSIPTPFLDNMIPNSQFELHFNGLSAYKMLNEKYDNWLKRLARIVAGCRKPIRIDRRVRC